MFDNHTYSILFGLFQYISPILTLWYIYLFFFKLYPRMAKASLISQTYRRNPREVKEITNEEVLSHLILSQVIVSFLMKMFERRK